MKITGTASVVTAHRVLDRKGSPQNWRSCRIILDCCYYMVSIFLVLELAAATEGCLYIYGTTYRCDCSWRPLTSTYSKFYIGANPVRMAVTFTIFELTLRGKRTLPPVLHPAMLLIIVCPQHEAYSLQSCSSFTGIMSTGFLVKLAYL